MFWERSGSLSGTNKTWSEKSFPMSDTLHSFSEGPYDLLNYSIETNNGKVVIEVNNGGLGRLPIENMETVEQLREALEKVEAHFKELKRRQEEL